LIFKREKKIHISTKILKFSRLYGVYGDVKYGVGESWNSIEYIVKEKSIGWGWVGGVGGEGEVSTHWCGGVLKNKNGMT